MGPLLPAADLSLSSLERESLLCRRDIPIYLMKHWPMIMSLRIISYAFEDILVRLKYQ